MHNSALLTQPSLASDDLPRHDHLRHAIDHAAHLLPTQGPITVFVHHNTLHAFEHLPFEQAVLKGAQTYGCEPYFSEGRYREELARERILPADLSAVLLADLGDDADALIGFMGTRYHLRLAMLEHSLQTGSDAEIRWVVSETDALNRFRKETADHVRLKTIDETRQWVQSGLHSAQPATEPRARQVMEDLLRQFNTPRLEGWSESAWESFTLHLLWNICREGVRGVPQRAEPAVDAVRHQSLLRQATGHNCDALVHDMLIRFCAAFLDQGFSRWPLPDRDQGFLAAFATLYGTGRPEEPWLNELPTELRRMQIAKLTPLESIADSLSLLGIPEDGQEAYITQTLLALPGWAGMIWQMETNAEWAVRPSPAGTLLEFLAVRLILDRLAATATFQEAYGVSCPLNTLRDWLRQRAPQARGASVDQRAHLIFQLAQVRGWSPRDLFHQSPEAWCLLVEEIAAFNELERRRIYHLAYERRYRTWTLDAVLLHQSRPQIKTAKAYQVVTCIDDREESFRRHLEETDPSCQTFGAPGFFAVPIYYQGAAEAHYRPLCPVVIKPQHWVRESVAYSLISSSRQRQEARKTLGNATHQLHVQSRTFWGGMLTALLGSLASIPIVTRILFPRITSRCGKLFQRLIQPPPVTELMLLRTEDPPGPDGEHLGFSRDEMADSVERILRDIGLTRDFARIVLLVGHGSGSLNNPHESAYNCGACSGGRGGPNARALAYMANHPEVRSRLLKRGIEIPATTIFVGAYHNTCDEDVEFFDLDRIPTSHRREFEAARDAIDEARTRNAHEKSRRFESADLTLTPRQALEHVQVRAEDLSQARPEYNHATNAMCIVGRRSRTRGLYMDRRVFLNDYDPHQDTAESAILARILAAAVPVCAGISLEYYFSCVDVFGYGCGSKLPHNIVSLLGVMEGAASDLRTGLSQQMIEIHEPMRILFVIETTPSSMLGIMQRNPVIGRLVLNEWVQLALLDPDSAAIRLYQRGKFEPYQPESTTLASVATSREWYQGRRNHLEFAEVGLCAPLDTSIDQESDE